MSAFPVASGHIDVLVTALRQARLIAAGQEREVGTMLWAENYASVAYRYADENGYPPIYTPHTTRGQLDEYAVLKACACYEYQSCEHPGWQQSQAHALIESLRTPIAARLGPFYRTERYEALPFEFTDVRQALACHQKGQ